MNKVIIMADSTCDLTQELLSSRQIELIPLYVNFGEQSYRDGVDIQTEELYQKVEELGYLPKTSAISPGDFIVRFEPYIEQGYDIVMLTIGSKLSGTYQAALVAQSNFDEGRVQIIDTQNLSSGGGLLALKACDFRDKGLSASEIKAEVDKLVPRVRSQFAIQTMEYLYKGGRCSALSMFLGSVLSIKPIIQVNNGKLDVYKKSVGKMTRALDQMLEDYYELFDKVDKDYVMITHSLADKSAAYMKEHIQNHGKLPKALLETTAGCVISTHCGKGTIGILYILTE
ncbi:DegV family protein with EDD domain [Acholeplasma morum]|uniref:DegV family protein n=1 Tax=Paracholeplasma morum TaxID=264637 RepID=UPI001957F6E4|nr:DegV family protein [Paracholeplasma morum]MBM7453295.1 DegV family protein with EDD domain [Paracholeplasma morum]